MLLKKNSHYYKGILVKEPQTTREPVAVWVEDAG